MCQASLAFSIMVFGVKTAATTLPPLEIVFFRSFLGTLMIGLLMIQKRVSFLGKPEERKFLLLRGISGFLALTLHFYTIAHLPLGTAVMLNYTAIIFVAILATLFIGERPGVFLISMILISFAGVYLLVKPETQLAPEQGISVFMGLLSAIFAAIAVLSIRLVKQRESPLTVIFYFTFIATLGSLLCLPFGFKWPSLKEWVALLVIVVGSFYGQIWMTIAYRRAPASLVAPFAYITPLASFLYGLLFWKETLTLSNLWGVLLITLGGISISIYESRRIKPSFASA
ncbi:MAG: DMT family transporter [Candidatus Omnitrophica bacterium]|nr:DMT family transporter [Candidatus Omnitrophota bacterium]